MLQGSSSRADPAASDGRRPVYSRPHRGVAFGGHGSGTRPAPAELEYGGCNPSLVGSVGPVERGPYSFSPVRPRLWTDSGDRRIRTSHRAIWRLRHHLDRRPRHRDPLLVCPSGGGTGHHMVVSRSKDPACRRFVGTAGSPRGLRSSQLGRARRRDDEGSSTSYCWPTGWVTKVPFYRCWYADRGRRRCDA